VDRDAIIEALRDEGIGTGVHFISLHQQPYYQQAHGYREGQFPVAEDISRRTLSLPLSAKLTDGEVDRVIEAFRKVLIRYEKG